VLDFDKDSWMDFFFTRADGPPVLLRNSPAQRFTPVDLPVAGNIVGGSGAAAIDFDNDGFIDLIFIIRETMPDAPFKLKLLRNMGSGRFEDVSERTQLGRVLLQNPGIILVVDLDNDGDTDLIVTQAGAPPVVL